MFIQGGDSMYNVQKNKKKNSDAKIAANDRYNKKHYKNISIRIKPDQADFIRDTAKKKNLSIIFNNFSYNFSYFHYLIPKHYTSFH